MPNKKQRTVRYRRKRAGKTDYNKRLILISGGLTRLVIRKSNKGLVAQAIEYRPDGDKVIVQANSKELTGFGWKLSTGCIPASYLTGLLAGIRAAKTGIKKMVLDIGLQSPIKGSRIYSAVKGAIDAGVEIAHDNSVFPDEKRIKGEHIVEYNKQLTKEAKEGKGKAAFSRLIKDGADPATAPQAFESVKQRILSGSKEDKK